MEKSKRRRRVCVMAIAGFTAAALLGSTSTVSAAPSRRVHISTRVAQSHAAHAKSAHRDVNGLPCSWTLSGVPAQYRIGIDHPTVHIDGDCTYSDSWFASANVHWVANNKYVPGNEEDFNGCSYEWTDPYNGECINWYTFDEFDSTLSASFNLNHAGRMYTHIYGDLAEDWPSDFYDTSYPEPTYFTSKYGTETSDTPVRSGSTVRFTATPRHWSVGYHAWVHTYDAQVMIERYENGVWVPLKTLTPSASTGNVTWSLTSSTPYYYRAVTVGTYINWGSASSSKLG